MAEQTPPRKKRLLRLRSASEAPLPAAPMPPVADTQEPEDRKRPAAPKKRLPLRLK